MQTCQESPELSRGICQLMLLTLEEGSASIQQSREPLPGNAVCCSNDFKAAPSECTATTLKIPSLNIWVIRLLLLLSLHQSNRWNCDGLMIAESQGVLWEVMPFFHTPSLTSKFGSGGKQWKMEHFPFSSLDPVHTTHDLTLPDCSRAGWPHLCTGKSCWCRGWKALYTWWEAPVQFQRWMLCLKPWPFPDRPAIHCFAVSELYAFPL